MLPIRCVPDHATGLWRGLAMHAQLSEGFFSIYLGEKEEEKIMQIS